MDEPSSSPATPANLFLTLFFVVPMAVIIALEVFDVPGWCQKMLGG